MIAFIQLMNYLVMPFSSLPGLINSMQQSLGAAGRIFEVLDSPVEVETLPEVETKQPEFESMVMSSISFSYPGAERQSINKISLELQKGTQMAVVGPSGGGKSTLFKLLLGLYEPDEGEVIINGQRINEMSLAKLRSYFPMCRKRQVFIQEAFVIISGMEIQRRMSKKFWKLCEKRMPMIL